MSLDLAKTEKQLDEALKKETKESLLKWLDEQKTRIERQPKAVGVQQQVIQKIAGIRWESRYSATLEDDKMGRWMRLGRINGMTVAIILKAKERFIVKLPNNKSDESLENAIIVTSENEAMLEAEKYIAKYVSNFFA